METSPKFGSEAPFQTNIFGLGTIDWDSAPGIYFIEIYLIVTMEGI
jgi:hypothetical protein